MAFRQRLNFVSIGTHDLIQYTLEIDRADAAVAHLCDHLHPAVLQLISRTIRAGEKARTPVGVCDAMAGELELTELLLGMGLRQVSMHPSQILGVKERVLETSRRIRMQLAASVLKQSDALQIRKAFERAVRASARRAA